LAPLAIVVPSDSLRQRLKWLLCMEQGHSLLDVHFLTFFQVAIRLLTEANSFEAAHLRPEFFFRELVHHLLDVEAPGSRWASLSEMPGAWGALIATLRDLKDAQVDEKSALEALSQSQLDTDQLVRSLLKLYRTFLDEKERMRAYDQDDLAAQAMNHVAQSRFLGRQHRVLYYGFYDLTQVQLDLFRAVARAYPVTLFFPLVRDHPAYAFADRFFERYLHGLVTRASDAVTLTTRPGRRSLAALFDRTQGSRDREGRAAPLGPACHILSVSGRLDEVTIVAKDILRLVEERGCSFRDVGLVARTLSGYETIIPRVFDEHSIPFTSTMGRPLGVWPYIKSVIQLLDIRVWGFRREQVIDLLSSPCIRYAALCPSCESPRPDLWDLASRRLGITKGLEDWRRLTAFLERDLPLGDDEERELIGPRIPAQQVRGLWLAVSTLGEALNALPDTATWIEYADQLASLCQRFLDADVGPPAGDQTATASLMDRFSDGLDELRRLGDIRPEVSLPDFDAAFRRLMDVVVLPLESTQGDGVQVLDAMAARGVPFRALYVLGLNEKVFPRFIHEDAFLRDRVRRLLEVDLGFKIQEKLAGYDEEKLLFYLLCNAARDELTLLYQRADDAGRPLVPSSYLSEVELAIGQSEVTVPRRLAKKFAGVPQYRIEYLSASELTMKLLLDRRLPRRLLHEGHPAGALIERGLRILHEQEQVRARLGPYDGMTGPLQTFWQTLRTSGVSPTGLQEYAKCPFRYFAGRVLRLEPLTVPESVDQVGPLELGTLAHRILRMCLETLRAGGYFVDPAQSAADPFAVLEETASVVFEDYARSQPVGYPLIWSLRQEGLVGFLRGVLHDDLAELSGKWEPVLFEEEMKGRLSVSLEDATQEPEDLPVSGRLDRVDWCRSANIYRIIDYKFRASSKPGPLDKNLKLGAARGLRLQPPFYLLMAESTVPSKLNQTSVQPTCDAVWFYYLAPNWDRALTRVRFPGDAWSSGLREPLRKAISQMLNGIRLGRFFIYPSAFCDGCDYRLVCRKTHQPTAWRARQDREHLQPYRELLQASPVEARQGRANARRPDAHRALPPDREDE
ncbi:MAG: PD-(D/E)XK nuclease family protein, partial [Nitrospiraceae bacterium]